MTVFDIGKIKSYVLKQRLALKYMKQCITINASHAWNLMSQFSLRREKEWLDVPSYLETQFHMSFNKNWLYISTTVSSTALRVTEPILTAKKLSNHFLLLDQISNTFFEVMI